MSQTLPKPGKTVRLRRLPVSQDLPATAPGGPGSRTILLVLASYLAALAAATWPFARTFGTRILGDKSDPSMHLWLVRWAKTCLLEGRSPFFNPGVHYPVGVPLGFYPTMPLQSAQYLLLSSLGAGDTLCLNLMDVAAMLGTGMAAFGLAWWVARDRTSAWLAGLGVMLSGPMMMHAHGHTELLNLWSFPLFLFTWVRLVDRPDTPRMLASAAAFVLLAACAPYFPILAVIPATWYLAWAWGPARWDRVWLLGRVKWLAGFSAAVLPVLAVLFSAHIWSAWNGYHVSRSKLMFSQFRAPIWGYFVPSPDHALARLLAPSWYGNATFDNRMIETSSYPGAVVLGVLAYSAIRRVWFPRASYWWSALGMMAVMSLGAKLKVAGHEVSMPAAWVWSVFPPFALIRVPPRFNLFVMAAAAVPVAAGLKDLLGRIKQPGWRVAAGSALAVGSVADLAMVPFQTDAFPPLPAYYRDMAAKTPHPAIHDAPAFISHEILPSTALWGYWQSLHGGSTTATYTSHPNEVFDGLVVIPSPWGGRRLRDPDYLKDPASETFGAARGVGFLDYCWLFLNTHRLDYVALHQGSGFEVPYGAGQDRLKALLADAKSHEDPEATIYDRAKFRAPGRLAWLCAEGWMPCRVPNQPWAFGVLREARIAAFNPDPGRAMTLSLIDASAYNQARDVRIVADGRELARWRVEPGAPRTLESPPLKLPAGLVDLKVVSDGDERPVRSIDSLDGARTPYSLRINAVQLQPVH